MIQKNADSDYLDSVAHWDLGRDVNWNKIENSDQVILWGKGPFTIMVPSFN